MKIYNYDKETKILMDSREATKDLDPESVTGWLLPAQATFIEPPRIDDNTSFLAFYAERNNWVIVQKPLPVKEEGVIIEDPNTLLAQEIRMKRDALLFKADIRINMLEDSDLDTNLMRSYRKSLRDITKQSSFPTEVYWPIEP
jgi:hypothetical protein